MIDTSMRDPFAFARGGELLALIAEERSLEDAANAAYGNGDVVRAEDLTDLRIGVRAKLRHWRPQSLAELVALIDYWRGDERNSYRFSDHIVAALRELAGREAES
ncbi:MAG TPA: hypothetical protein VMF32_03025 [Xanthobacteraceae bacterium]|nr:hypothetical protein [Xanthobacteraceae bacterium]